MWKQNNKRNVCLRNVLDKNTKNRRKIKNNIHRRKKNHIENSRKRRQRIKLFYFYSLAKRQCKLAWHHCLVMIWLRCNSIQWFVYYRWALISKSVCSLKWKALGRIVLTEHCSHNLPNGNYCTLTDISQKYTTDRCGVWRLKQTIFFKC